MEKLPPYLLLPIFQILNNEIFLEEFEQWAYTNSELEKFLGEDDYIDLITLNYKERNAKYALFDLLKNHIDNGELETYKLLFLLKAAKKRNEDLPDILLKFFDLFNEGYLFLDQLSYKFSLRIAEPDTDDIKVFSWYDLSNEEQNNIINSFYPDLDAELDKIIFWIENKTIVLKGQKNKEHNFVYDDYRKAEDIPKNNFYFAAPKPRKWFEFWNYQKMNSTLSKIIIIISILSILLFFITKC